MIYARALLTRIIATFFALAVLSIAPAFATAEGEQGAGPNAAPVQCIASDGSLVPAPAGTPGGAPGPCPTSTPETPPPPPPAPAEEPEPEAQPQPPAQTPLDQPAPATDPQTPPPASAGGAPAATPTAGGAPSRPTPKKPKTAKPDPRPESEKKRKPRRERGTGPDDGTPPAPPSSLLQPVPAAGGPSPAGPVGAYVLPAPTTRGVPNILLDGFRVPPFLLPIYQAAGVQYGVRWEILAAINSIETDYGRNLNVSTAGALGWMQFMPATWASYGVDANSDGRKDPYNPVDAIFAAARYLRAAGAQDDLRKAIWAYNHADWYVNDVLRRAHALSALPPEVVASLSGMTLGRFPVAAPATYAGRLSSRAARARVSGGNASIAVEGGTQRGRRVFAEPGAPVVAVQDSRVVSLGTSPRLGTYIRLRDAYGNTYTYGHLARLASVYPVARPRKQSAASIRRELGVVASDPHPEHAASAGTQKRAAAEAPVISAPPLRALHADRAVVAPEPPAPAPVVAATSNPTAGPSVAAAPLLARYIDAVGTGGGPPGGLPRLPVPQPKTPAALGEIPAGVSAFRAVFAEPSAIDRRDVVLKPLERGAKVIGGTVLGRIGAASLTFSAPQGADAEAEARAERATAARLQRPAAPHLYFEVRPAGKKTPRIDPKPLLDGWRLLDSTAIYRARNPVLGAERAIRRLSTGQIMLMSKEQLIRHVLDNPDIEIYSCGRADIRAGIVDRRVLASISFLAARGMKPTITSLRCGHGFFTASGNVSHHSSGDAVDIAAINGVPIAGHQGPGSVTDRAVRALLTLQGTMKPAQIITLMQYAGTDNTMAMADHWDHIHLGFQPDGGDAVSMLRPDQWDRLVTGLGKIRNPVVPIQPSRWSIAVTKRAPARSAKPAAKRSRATVTRRAPKTVAQARRHDAANRPRVG